MSCARYLLLCLIFVVSFSSSDLARAQKIESTGGFDFTARPVATGEERQAQPDLWILELQYKSLRMIETSVTDARTGSKQPQLLYYLVYRALNRPIDRKEDQTDTRPINDLGETPAVDLFVPEVTLVTTDNGVRRVVKDAVVPEAQTVIARRERIPLLNTVEAVQQVPEPVDYGTEDPDYVYGVAVFPGVSPETDYFTLFLSGFSNGYKLVKGPVAYDDLRQLASDGDMLTSDQVWNGDLDAEWRAAAQVGDLFDNSKLPPDGALEQQWYYTVTNDRIDASVTVWRKTLTQDYWRPGDSFDQNEREIRTKGLPRWIYRPDDTKPAASEPVQTAATAK